MYIDNTIHANTMENLFKENIDENIVRISEIRSLIKKYDEAYYNHAESLVSDYEYDMLFEELQQLEKQYPQHITPDSPTQRVGGNALAEFAQVIHSTPMLSLSNTYNNNDLDDFDKRVASGLEGEKYQYFAELKYDGVSISIEYKDGTLFRASTRGDGVAGDDVTSNVRTIRALPIEVNSIKIDGIVLKNFEIRGEIYFSENEFLFINEKRAEMGEKLYANARNLAAGTLKLLNSKDVGKRRLQIVCYYLYTNDIKLKFHHENIQILKALGFPVCKEAQLCENINEAKSYINEWHTKRFNLGFQTDGIVIKVDSLRQQDYLGNISRSPRWAIAYKYEPETAETILKNITLQVGRTGAITPVAELEPVFLAGSTISRATLHNADFIETLDLHIGDTVAIEKGGDVIPKVTRVIMNKRLSNSTKYEFPKECACDLKTPIYRVEGEANYYCENPNCPWQIRRRIEHFASRNAMNITGLGEKVVDKLVAIGYLLNISYIYELHDVREKLIAIDGWGEKSVDNLIDAIENSKSNSMEKLLFALGIRFVGEKTAKILSKHFASIDALQYATKEQLLGIYEIGDKVADSVIKFFSDENELKILSRLKNSGLNFESKSDEALTGNKLEGKTFVFTGELQAMSRQEAVKLVEKQGGKEAKSVSKNTSYVVVGAAPGSKYDKALSLGIAILTESDFLEFMV